uniref:Uncharacterized protein n=1 Tax=Coccidioides posadasii RMSCC 3488 TaxID=454284 RepID=A0A0J6FTH7_COCPO|nr:hypothetical protein CPAG_08979 [Coccidioides posadasii RMSCC 3488]
MAFLLGVRLSVWIRLVRGRVPMGLKVANLSPASLNAHRSLDPGAVVAGRLLLFYSQVKSPKHEAILRLPDLLQRNQKDEVFAAGQTPLTE